MILPPSGTLTSVWLCCFPRSSDCCRANSAKTSSGRPSIALPETSHSLMCNFGISTRVLRSLGLLLKPGLLNFSSTWFAPPNPPMPPLAIATCGSLPVCTPRATGSGNFLSREKLKFPSSQSTVRLLLRPALGAFSLSLFESPLLGEFDGVSANAYSDAGGTDVAGGNGVTGTASE